MLGINHNFIYLDGVSIIIQSSSISLWITIDSANSASIISKGYKLYSFLSLFGLKPKSMINSYYYFRFI